MMKSEETMRNFIDRAAAKKCLLLFEKSYFEKEKVSMEEFNKLLKQKNAKNKVISK